MQQQVKAIKIVGEYGYWSHIKTPSNLPSWSSVTLCGWRSHYDYDETNGPIDCLTCLAILTYKN